ncbi:DGQHR domain-containing protein [Amphritea pacifica]|uniref:DGQHR domain-containing protein n=1 Tax=Amphritea pacifica TaxID=2811233 RepID=UPI002FCD98F6
MLSSNEESPVYDDATGELTLSNKKSSMLVIDGQHRLYGAYQSDIDVELPVCIFYGLDRSTEVQYFLDVNSYQIGVPKTLRLELEKFTAEEDSEEYLLRALYDELDENPASPLSGKVARTKSVTGKISHVAFQNALKPVLDKAPFKGFDLSQKKKVLINFLRAVETILQEIFDDCTGQLKPDTFLCEFSKLIGDKLPFAECSLSRL